MGKAFRRLEKQVQDRRAGAARSLSYSARLRSTEVFLLELGSYLQKHVATNPEDASDQALLEAYTDFKKALEGTVQ